jgi:hypothetical protein
MVMGEKAHRPKGTAATLGAACSAAAGVFEAMWKTGQSQTFGYQEALQTIHHMKSYAVG